MTFHRSVMGRGAKIVNDVTLKDYIKRKAAVAEVVTTCENKATSWVTSCPHCDRIIGITLKGNGK